MALDVDTNRQMRRPAEFASLVRAIERAASDDELLGLEWKSEADLGSKKSQFMIAKNILAMANRSPSRIREFEGWGYLVLGAEPGNAAGVVTVDPAVYVKAVNEYVGDANGPEWHTDHFEVDGRVYVVVRVAPSKQGDQIWPLRKEYQEEMPNGKLRTWQSGTVFIRRPGRSEQANGTDVDMLSARARVAPETPPGVELNVHESRPLPWLDVSTATNATRRRIDAAADQLHADAIEENRQRDSRDTVPTNVRDLLNIPAFDIPGEFADSRTFGEFRQETEDWRRSASRLATRHAIATYLSSGRAKVRFLMTNSSDRYLSDCQLRVEFETSDLAVFARFTPLELPPPPSAFGEATRLYPGLSTEILLPSDDFDQERPTSFNTAILKIGDLRPRSVATSEPVWVLLFAPPAMATLEASWSLTARDLHAVVSGTCAIALSSDSWPAIDQHLRSSD